MTVTHEKPATAAPSPTLVKKLSPEGEKAVQNASLYLADDGALWVRVDPAKALYENADPTSGVVTSTIIANTGGARTFLGLAHPKYGQVRLNIVAFCKPKTNGNGKQPPVRRIL